MVFAQWVPHSFHNQGHTMIPSLLIWTAQNYLNPTAHMVSVQRGKNIYKKKERKKDDSLNPTILFGRLSPDHTLRWSCVSALSRENLYTLFCSLGYFPFSQLLVYAPPASRAFWHPALPDSSLVWHSLKPGRVSNDLQGRWLHPGFLTLTTDAFREMLQSLMVLLLFFFLELTFFVVVVFFPMAEGSPSSKWLKDNIRGNMLYFCFSLLWKNIFSGAFGWPSFHSHPCMGLVGTGSSALLGSAPGSHEEPVRWLVLQPLLMCRDPLKSLQRGCLQRGCRYNTVKYGQYRLYCLMIQTLFLMSKQRHFFILLTLIL